MLILHHDNPMCHTSAETPRYLEGQKVELTGHSPYNSDLAPNDFYLFPSVKNNLPGQHFSSREEAVDTFKMHFLLQIYCLIVSLGRSVGRRTLRAIENQMALHRRHYAIERHELWTGRRSHDSAPANGNRGDINHRDNCGNTE
ncbi:hypothetical protein EVAR_51454_1 [Eumeta japonica]|uniref:Mariner Mos1 transposase n=1 Tax=Eumeta variegata TaxID=151549 RepID=A0A4C1XSJ8_EUMVA|nr:hypothetical protein EVAR_51454_1 [Eumeta japonica]